MQKRFIQTGYLLGVSLLLTSVFYFFASNWQGLDRITKVGLSIALVLFFYTLHFLLFKKLTRHHFLSEWMLVVASVMFGLSIALIGQIYNSHADSYLIFLVWLIPIFLLAVITRYSPFYLFTYILMHLTIYFFLTPSSFFIHWTEDQLILILFGVAILNAFIFYMSVKPPLNSKPIKYTSFAVFHYVLLYLTILSTKPAYISLTNGLYVLLLASGIFYLYKIKRNRILFSIHGVFAAIYLIYKSMNWISNHLGEWALFFFLLLAILLVTTSVQIVKYMNRNPENKILKSFIIVIVTLIATLFATLSITGLFFLLFPGGSATALFFFSVGALVIPNLFGNWADQIKYPMITTGFLVALGASLFEGGLFYRLILLFVLSFALYLIKTKGLKVFIYLLLNIVLILIIALEIFQPHTVIASLLVANALYYFIQTKELATRYTALIISFFAFITLTIVHLSTWQSLLYNISFFIITTAALFILSRETKPWEWTLSLIFWFLFIVYKYYEFMWKLIHKSILFLILGLVLIAVTNYFDKKNRTDQIEKPRLSYKCSLMLIVILLQVGFVSYQSATNEILLRNGTLIKVKLAPVDPRSMLQGDYVILRYEITSIPESNQTGFWNDPVKVVLRENEQQLYDYAGYVQVNGDWNKPYEPQQGDVIINGRMNGPNEVVYGIESFFVPEGEGRELQNNVQYAYLRVSQSGNAIVEKIE